VIWLVAAAAALTAVIAALIGNARAFIRRVEEKYPPLGRVNSLKLHVIERGAPDGAPVLLLHGATANAREFLTLAPLLEADHRLLMADRPGYGYSRRVRRAERIETQALLFARLLEDENAAPAIIVCHSLGCGVGLRLAIERPDLVSGIVLIAPASHPYPGGNAWWAELAATPLIGALFSWTLVPLAAPGAAKGAIANSFWPAPPPTDYQSAAAVPLAFRPGAFRASAREVVATKREYRAQAPRYGEIDAPTIVITADKDRVVSPKIHARGIAADLPSVELITLPGAGHMPHHVRPEAVAGAVRRVREIQRARGAD